MKIYLARHAQTNYNELGLCNDDPAVDVYLTQTGFNQAQELAQRLKSAQIDRIFVSKLKRTRQTAEIINTFHGAPIEVDTRLGDNVSGFEGKPSAIYYDEMEKLGDAKWEAHLNGGESLQDVKSRVQSFMDDLKTKPYKSVLIVTSRIIVQDIYGMVNGLSDQEAWEYKVDRGSCVELELR